MHKLWLDDVRSAPKGWMWASTFEEAVDLVKEHGLFEVMSLDHDLAPSHYRTPATDGHYHEGSYEGLEKTGMDFVLWLEETQNWPQHIIIHSMNPYGARRMHEVCARYVPSIIQPYTGLER